MNKILFAMFYTKSLMTKG